MSKPKGTKNKPKAKEKKPKETAKKPKVLTGKPKVITEFEKLDEDIQKLVKLEYPLGFEKNLITFKNHKKHLISALPYETADRHYLVKMSREKANDLILKDEDYNENGMLINAKKEKYEKKFAKILAKQKESEDKK